MEEELNMSFQEQKIKLFMKDNLKMGKNQVMVYKEENISNTKVIGKIIKSIIGEDNLLEERRNLHKK